MFYHNFKYSLKTLFSNKVLLFWTFVFPIIMSMFFNLAFSDIESGEMLHVIDIAIVDNDEFRENVFFKEAFDSLSKDNDDKLFNIEYVSLDKAQELLENENISGYILLKSNGNLDIVVNSNGINETVIKTVVDEIESSRKTIENLTTTEINNIENKNYNINQSEIIKKVYSVVSNTSANIKDISKSNLSYTMIEYYTLIAMACLYGGILSMFIINYRLANMNSIGKRTSISKISKSKMILSSLLASYLVQLIGVFLLFIFTTCILKVDYGDKLIYILVLACLGSLAGLSLGLIVGSIFKTNENSKLGILIAITMTCCFLSGMMGITMKYIIDTNIPILNIINPANMITDGLYSLYYYDTLERFNFNLISLILFSIVMIIISIKSLRRQKYDSI